MKVLVTGSSGLIGSEAVDYFLKLGQEVVGADCQDRRVWFGTPSQVDKELALVKEFPGRYHQDWTDVSDENAVDVLFRKHAPFDAIIHCAAQPSHDFASSMPGRDFAINATGTLNLLGNARHYSSRATFIFMSTNKVYGDRPNRLPFREAPTRFQHEDAWWHGFTENTPIDQCLHSVFGVSKLAADIMTQEYGRLFGLKTVIFRAGCVTGRRQQGVEQHGFLSYLAKCVMQGKKYRVYGYKGKQVRDNLHSADMVRAMAMVIGKPPEPGAVFNIGGGFENSISVIEAIEKVERIANKRLNWEYTEANRVGDHICYITDFWKFKACYPEWDVTMSLDRILTELVENERSHLGKQVQAQTVR